MRRSSTRLRGLTVGLARNAYNIVSTSKQQAASLTNSSVFQPESSLAISSTPPLGTGAATLASSGQVARYSSRYGSSSDFQSAKAGLSASLVSLAVVHRDQSSPSDILFERGVPARKFASTKIEAHEN